MLLYFFKNINDAPKMEKLKMCRRGGGHGFWKIVRLQTKDLCCITNPAHKSNGCS